MPLKFNADVNIDGQVIANSFLKKDGTSAQFLKADGSVDSNTYITGLSNITEIANRSYNDLQDLPTLNTLNWDTAYGWGNHADAGYLTSVTEDDGIVYFNAGYVGGLTFIVTAEWVLGGIHYPRIQQEITLDPADTLYGRIDVIAIDNTGSIIKITGVPKENPAKPSIDPVTQIEGTFVTIAANATSPEGISVNLVYNENAQTAGGEWNTSVFPGGITTINLSSTVSPFNGTYSIEGTGLAQYDAIQFTPPAPFDISTVSQLGYRIKNKVGNYGNGDTHRFQLWGTDAQGVEQTVVLGTDTNYVSSNTTDYQYLNIPIPQDTTIVNVTRIRFINYTQTNKTFGFYLDDIRLVDADSEVITGNYASITYVNNKDSAILDLVEGKADFTDTRIINGQTAYEWGDHAGLYEPTLGNPSVSGYVLSSDTAGNRSWVAAGTGGSIDQDNIIRHLIIAEADLPAGYTETDVLNYINTLGLTITDKEVISWEVETTASSGTLEHNHDDRYYTETEIETKLSGYVTTSGIQTISGAKTFTSASYFEQNIELNSGWFITSAGTRTGIGGLPNMSANPLQVHGGMDIDNGDITFRVNGATTNVLYSGGLDTMILRNFGTEPSTLLEIRSKAGDPTIDTREATLALTRTDDAGNAEFIDLYNNGYPSGSPISVQYGIRVQKRGTGLFRPFVFDWYDGVTYTDGFTADITNGFTFQKPIDVTTIKEGGIALSSKYEPIISNKGTAFNKDFGTTVGTVAEGNDSRITNGQTAHGWGDHSAAGYATTTDLENRTPVIKVVTQAEYDALGDTSADPTLYIVK